MSYAVYLSIQAETLQRFQQVTQQLHQGTTARQAKILSEVLTDLACHVIDQVFSEIMRHPKALPQHLEQQGGEQSSQVIDKIMQYIRKYMPYSIALLSNERLKPLVDYLNDCIKVHDGQYYLSYPIDDGLAAQQIASFERINAGDDQAVQLAFGHLIKIIDLGVDALLLRPKNILKFNVIINKSLDGVINLCTHLGYQRIEQVTAGLSASQVKGYLDHFLTFLHQQHQDQFSYQ